MSRTRTALIAALWLATLGFQGGLQTVAAQETTIRIAVVDVNRVVSGSAAGEVLQGRLESFHQETRQQIERMTRVAGEIRRRLAEGVNTLSERQLAELQKEYEDQGIAIRRFQDDKQSELRRIQEEGLREIEKSLEPIFARIRDEDRYDLILNKIAGTVIMASDRVDITQLVIDRFDAAANSGG